MEIKEVKPISFLVFRTETTVAELVRFLNVGQHLIREAVDLGLSVTGPVHWHYHGFFGTQTDRFELEIALPVGDVLGEYDGEFHFKRTELFKCVSIIHEGSWLDIPASYQRAMQFIAERKLSTSASNREIYINADSRFPEANTTEIQIGII